MDAARFGKKFIGSQQAEFDMRPEGRNLCADNFAIGQIDNGLVVQDQLAAT